MQIQRCVSLCMALLSLAAGASLSAVEPASEKPTWGEEPVVGISSTRGEMVLNGLWRFQPGVAGGREPADDGWGLIRVPGSWRTGYTPIAIPGVAVPGSGASWDPWRNDSLSVGWYERPLRVPSQWNGRAILLDMERVSTDAWVYLDGREAGRVGWPGGEVDITRLATPDREHQLRIFVAAIPGEGQVGTFMGPGAGQVSFGESNLQSKGIVGDVILRSRPRGAYISDVFVQTSTRRKQIALSVELTGIEHAGPVRLTARTERNGKVEKTFVRTVAVQAARVQILTVSWPWPNPALWDLDQPNLYTVKLNAEGAGLKDAYAQLFGFREFWVEGRKLFLNGVEIRFRPQVFPDTWNSVSGTRELVEGSIKGLRWAGHNIAELWPGEMMRRGQHEFREVIYDAADRLGFPLMGSAGCMNGFLRWGDPRWVNRAEWERLTRYEMRRARNHPSILIWTSSGNIFGHSHDQHPQALGRDNWYSDAGLRHGAAIESGLAFVRSLDPTRPAFIHQGILGYLYAVNTYLDLTPLQEREEWLSAWAEQGRKPYLAVEFGTPLNGTFLRGRADYFQACTTEPWATEFAATYFGPEAYHLETPAYRAAIRDHFQKEQIYGNWQGAPQLNFAPTTQAVEDLFVRNTWRSWRAQGMTAGMVPWDRAEGWETVGNEEVDAPPFQPGRRGTYAPRLAKEYLYYLRPEGGFKLHGSARALMANNGPTLAYIAGAPDFTDKQHAFWTGQGIHKQAVLINDHRTPQSYRLTWKATVAGRQIASGSRSGILQPACNLLIPLSFNAPRVGNKTDCTLELKAKIGKTDHDDRFAFRIFPRPATENGVLAVYDPVGKTSAMLRELGFTIHPWNGEPTASLVVVGREALSDNVKMPGSLESFVRDGGRVLCFAQQPAVMERIWGFRVSRHVSRRVFPISAAHPVMAGLDAADLRDWAGAGDLLPARTRLPEDNVEPPYGWHWGNRGSVASAAVEKPHLAAWRPILECEFDGAYSPLMELDYGRGRMTLCLLDLDGRTGNEPAANRLARAVVRYARTAPLHPRAERVVLLGKAPAWLDLLDLKMENATSLPVVADLVIVASDAVVDESVLRAVAERGGNVVFLPRRIATAPLGLSMEQRTIAGSLDVPDGNIADGLSPSDLRWRTETTGWLASGGATIGAGGQIAMKRVGKGLVVWLQLDPDRFDADRQTYFRFTRWRQTRAVAQVLANLGATFRADANALATAPGKTDSMPRFYHPDYRADFNLGDDPFRYKRW